MLHHHYVSVYHCQIASDPHPSYGSPRIDCKNDQKVGVCGWEGVYSVCVCVCGGGVHLLEIGSCRIGRLKRIQMCMLYLLKTFFFYAVSVVDFYILSASRVLS